MEEWNVQDWSLGSRRSRREMGWVFRPFSDTPRREPDVDKVSWTVSLQDGPPRRRWWQSGDDRRHRQADLVLGGGASDFEDAVSGRTRGRKSVDPLDTVSARGAALVTPAGLKHQEPDIVPCVEISSRRKPRLLDEKFAKSFNRLARYDFIPSLQQAWAVILPVARRQPRLHATARCRIPPVGLRAF
ncbi:hypothetical protein CKAH01_09519 [Colletotrichum kahawae]|uniref:Uncharacterized protein n=1 Tax=Colletotrichum kahawae TaxID=34407 RepID=A0AAD9XZS0_COLKA|nr:hypothetical protein CKAH01_09519 [Colletotrichum kahawae]